MLNEWHNYSQLKTVCEMSYYKWYYYKVEVF